MKSVECEHALDKPNDSPLETESLPHLVFCNFPAGMLCTFDLKTGDLTHQHIGQMDIYVRIMDDLKRSTDDNPTVGIILCTHKDASVVRYSVLHENEQMFASRYKLVLPLEEELRAELERERAQVSASTTP